MDKLYILQQILLRKEINMIVDISLNSEPISVNNDTFNYTEYKLEGPIPEVIEKYKKMLSTLEVPDINSLHFYTSKIRLEKNGFIRPNKFSELDTGIKFIFLTSLKSTKDSRGAEFKIFSDDGYIGYPLKEINTTIGFDADTRYEITRLVEGVSDFIITYVK